METRRSPRIWYVPFENLGFRIWYDEATLNIGDSVRRSIDKGLSESDYAVLILSPSFFEKEWPQRELDGLLAREEGTSKIILPVWHGVDFSAVRRFSPLLADRLAVNSTGTIATVAEAIARAIFRARGSISIATHMLSDQTELIVLADRPHEGFAIGVGRYPLQIGNTAHTATGPASQRRWVRCTAMGAGKVRLCHGSQRNLTILISRYLCRP